MTTPLKIVVGLGKTGISCVRYLVNAGCKVAVIDNRAAPPALEELRASFPEVEVFLGSFAAPFLDQADELIISPGVTLREPAIAARIHHGVNAIGDIELLARAVEVPIVAITGSNGKSTVTSLVGEMAKAAGKKVKVGGNLGTPVLELLDANAELYILELSSFQLETTYSLQPSAATLLNISPDHMDRYRDLAGYLTAKQRIYSGCKAAIINRDDPLTYTDVTLSNKIVSFGLSKPEGENFGINDSCLVYGNKNLLLINELKIKGLHNVANALAALALGNAINLPMPTMLAALRNFPGLPHRCQWVKQINGVNWYNDSKGTNVGATKAAIIGLGADIKGKVILLAGGIGKDADFAELAEPVKQYVRNVILFGKDGTKIASALPDQGVIRYAKTMAESVAIAFQAAQPEDAVLLSPACASFDMFDNFEHRGEVFMQEVQNLRAV